MRPQYYDIKECLNLLQENHIPNGTMKYQAEILLLRLLRLTLDDAELNVYAGPCSEGAVKALLHDLKALCASKVNGELAARFYERVREFALPVLPLAERSAPEKD